MSQTERLARQRSDLYFKSLAELDDWSNASSGDDDATLPYIPRSPHPEYQSSNRGKLLICHDYKGGYTETPFAPSYTFNFWSRCDDFIYFAHHRISTPPPGWINAAHRQGVRMLGTIIFEAGGEADCLKLLVGRLPTSKTKSAGDQPTSLPVSPHYARLLADLAKRRGFDGYLLNFECPLQGRFEQTRALTAWIGLLRMELKARVGDHAELIWYDSVVITGQLAWQDRLNAYNLPFFLPSTGFFTNYTWRRDYPTDTASFFTTLDPLILANDPGSNLPKKKALNDVYMGVDVWGRGSHGGGGLGCYRAIEHIAPESLGLSVALFGQAWTWETEQDKPGFTWEHWWAYERTLWVGPPGEEEVKVPEAPRRQGEDECLHGPFVPMSNFFTRKSPPNPAKLAFHTTFSTGVGRAWFVNGEKKSSQPTGWTDIDKQCSIGDMVWPKPDFVWEDEECNERAPAALADLCMEDAWNGGSSLRLAVSTHASDADDASFRQASVPIQSLSITPGAIYQLVVIYKIEESDGLELDACLSCNLIGGGDRAIQITPDDMSPVELPGGWIRLSARISSEASPSSVHDDLASVGLTISIATENPARAAKFSLLIGEMAMYPFRPPTAARAPQVLWADYKPLPVSTGKAGQLSWEVAVSFATENITLPLSPDVPIPVWNVEPAKAWKPSFLYFNIYVQEPVQPGGNNFASPELAKWIGTSGWDGKRDTFPVDIDSLPIATEGNSPRLVRFYVQGVTDHGEVLPWDACVYVETTI
ncbi:hypothetical protein EYR38_005052 [Pleurotus pulmonarius]|nr:hypothetical protein EYR38_005052 [Pleurotus pulmonarius]